MQVESNPVQKDNSLVQRIADRIYLPFPLGSDLMTEVLLLMDVHGKLDYDLRRTAKKVGCEATIDEEGLVTPDTVLRFAQRDWEIARVVLSGDIANTPAYDLAKLRGRRLIIQELLLQFGQGSVVQNNALMAEGRIPFTEDIIPEPVKQPTPEFLQAMIRDCMNLTFTRLSIYIDLQKIEESDSVLTKRGQEVNNASLGEIDGMMDEFGFFFSRVGSAVAIDGMVQDLERRFRRDPQKTRREFIQRNDRT